MNVSQLAQIFSNHQSSIINPAISNLPRAGGEELLRLPLCRSGSIRGLEKLPPAPRFSTRIIVQQIIEFFPVCIRPNHAR
jgi:hypothetical protein